MIEGACHCGAISWRFHVTPASLTDCNCSYCRRAHALWAYAMRGEIELAYAPAEVVRYIHGDRQLAFVSCRTCGCTTHWEPLLADGETRNDAADVRMAVNMRMAGPEALEHVTVRRFDGADSWRFLD